MSINLSPESPLGKQIASWWRNMIKDSASRAELKRCSNSAEVMLTSTFQHLCQQLQPQIKEAFGWQVKLAILVGLAAHLDRHSEGRVLQVTDDRIQSLVVPMAQDAGVGSRPLVSELRFRRLIQRQVDDLYTPMIRVIRMLKGKANLYGLAESIFYWGDEIKKRWAFAYFPKVSPKN